VRKLLSRLLSLRESSLFPVLVLAVILAVVLPVITERLVSPAFTEIMVDAIREDARRLGHLALPSSLKHSRLEQDRLSDRFFAEIYRLEYDLGLMKIKIFSPSGKVLYSTDTREIGTVNSHPYFTQEVARGIPVTKLVRRGKPTLEGQISTVDVVETYVPFMSDGRFLGAFEMYYDVSGRVERLNRLTAYSAWSTVLLSSGLALLMAMLAFKDVAQRRAQRETETLKEDVERITRHDLKAPIAGILGGLDFLRRYTTLDEEQASMVDEMRLTANTAMNLVNRSLDLYKMETGRYQCMASPVDMVRLVRRTLKDLAGLAGAHDVRVLFTREGRELREGDTLTVHTDETLVYALLANLLKNAIEASEPGQQVTLTLGGKEELRLTVHNRTAVPEEIRETFFDKYKTAGKRQGTGLGTYSAKLIAETLGGTIAMTTSEEKGTMLVVTLPATQTTNEE
jgi:signal transduction histidine kinase